MRNVQRFRTPLAALATAVLVLAGCASKRAALSRPAAIPVHVATATLRTMQPTETVAGLIAPRRSVALSSSLPEPALAVYVREGMHVNKGQILAVLATDDLRATLAAAQQTVAADRAKTLQVTFASREAFAQGSSGVISAQSTVLQARATLAEDDLNLKRYAVLFKQGYLSLQTLDAQRTRVLGDQQALLAAQAKERAAAAAQSANGTQNQGLLASNIAAAQAQARVDQAQAQAIRAQIARATIRSPIAGIVVNRNLNPGEYPAGRQIFTLQETSSVYAVLGATSAQAFAVRPGAPAIVTRSDGSNGRSARGVVTAVLPQVAPGSTDFTVKVSFPNPSGRWQAGMPVVATVALRPVRGIEIPSSAFLNDRDDSVFVVSRGRVVKTRVQELASDPGQSLVRGLAPGTRVVANGGLGLTNGARVAPQ